MQILERLRRLFFYTLKKNACKIEKSLDLRQKRVSRKEDRLNPRFESYTIPQRIGLRGVQSEQIQANSSFFRAVTQFFNI